MGLRALKTCLRRLETHVEPELEVEITPYLDTEEWPPRDVPVEPRRLLRRFRDAVYEAGTVVRLFAEGYGRARQTRTTGPKWEQRFLRNNHHAMTVGFRIFVGTVFSEMESLSAHFSRWWVRSPGALQQFRTWAQKPNRRLCPPDLAADDQRAREQFENWLKPSARAGGWERRARAAFGLPPSRPMEEAIRTLIAWRNEFSHPRRSDYRLNWGSEHDVESMVALMLAANLLVIRLSEAANRRP